MHTKIDLRQGDCLEIMKDIPDGSVDLILTDPPYGMNLTPQRDTGKWKGVQIKNDDSLDWAPEFFARAYNSLSKDGIGFFFCSHHSVGQFINEGKSSGFSVKNLLVWDKMWFGMGNNWRPNFELILVLTKGRFVTKSNNKDNILRYRRISPNKSLHPTEKPVGLLEELLVEPDNDPITILDPFMGSGTTGIACLNTNRNFIGIELDEKYFNIAKERIESHKPTAFGEK